MQYRSDKYGNQISALGFGCLRFPQRMKLIDMEKTEQQIMEAIRGGVNYFDTAYIYPGSEAALGEILEKNNARNQVYIATKLPHYLIKSRQSLDKYFNEELHRLRTDRVDYYLMHMLTDVDTWQRLKDLGIEQWLQEKRESGQIKQVGFSYHGHTDMFCKLIDVYDWDFCQIQYNYLDEHSQAGRTGLQYAADKGIPVIIMEPLRGGKLVNLLPDDGKRIIARHNPKQSPAQWALRWLWDQKEVTCVLSGMNSMEMVRENMACASENGIGNMTEADQKMLRQVVKAINAKMKVGCTGCGYCMPCPKHVDIPGTFAAYNSCYTEGKFHGLADYVKCTVMRKTSTAASNCVGCGKCEKHCPQGIAIRQELKNASRKLEGPAYKIARKLVKWFKAY